MNVSSETFGLRLARLLENKGVDTKLIDISEERCEQLADQLQREGRPVERMPDGTRRIVYDEQVEIFENWLEDQVVLWEGVPVISRKGLVFMKRKLEREKDLRDIALLRQAFPEEDLDC